MVLLLSSGCLPFRQATLPPPSEDALRSFFTDTWPAVQNARGEADVRLRFGDDVLTGGATWAYRAPDLLRVDVRDPFNRQIGLLLVRGDELVQIPADLPLLEHLAAVTVMSEIAGEGDEEAPASVMAALLAGMPVPAYRWFSRTWTRPGKHWKTATAAGREGRLLSLAMTPSGPAVAAVRFTSERSGRTVKLSYASRQTGQGGHPRALRMSISPGTWELELDDMGLETNVAMDDGLFILPAGLEHQ